MRFATLKLRTLYQVEFANSKKYKFQEEMNMAGTMSEKELRISCGITLGAEVKSLSRNTNASAMALSGNTVYLAKAHANENGKMVYKSMIFKSSQFVSDIILYLEWLRRQTDFTALVKMKPVILEYLK